MLAKIVTVGEVRGGLVTLVDLLKINALLDMQSAAERQAMERARRK